jgi:hypothetical protein
MKLHIATLTLDGLAIKVIILISISGAHTYYHLSFISLLRLANPKPNFFPLVFPPILTLI